MKTSTWNKFEYHASALLCFVGTFSWFIGVNDALLSIFKYGIFSVCIFFILIKHKNFKMSLLTKITLLYMLLILPSFLVSIDIYGLRQASFISYIIMPFLFCFVFSNFEDKKSALRISGGYFLVAVLIHSSYIMYTYLGGPNLAPFTVVGPWSRSPIAVMGFTSAHTAVAPMIAVAIGFLLIVLRGQSIPRHNHTTWGWIGLAAILAVALLLTGGEGGMVALAVSLAYLWCRKLKVAVPALLLSPFVIYLALPFLEAVVNPVMQSTLFEHKFSWLYGWEIFRNNPLFGVGFSQSSDIFYSSQAMVPISGKIYTQRLTPHSSLLANLAEGGVFAGIALMLVWFTGGYYMHKTRKSNAPEVKFAAFAAVYYFMLSFIEPWPYVSNFFSSVLLFMSLVTLEGFATSEKHHL